MLRRINRTEIARELRRQQTDEEKELWQYLRNRKLSGFKFLRQHPIVIDSNLDPPRFIIADFCCKEKRLIIELDGRIHDFQSEEDKARDFTLQIMGYRTLRIKNEEISDMITVLKRISNELNR